MNLLRRSKRRRGGEPPAEDPAAEASRDEAPASDAEHPEMPPGRKRRGWPGFRESVRATREALAPVGGRRVLAASVVLMAISAGAFLIFAGASFWWTSQPSFCARCHVMSPYIEQWKKSPHKDVNCESCHLTPGFFGFMGGKIAGLQVVMNYIRGNYEDWSFNAAVSNAACLQCHEPIMERNIHDPTIGITVSHRNIIGLGGKCLNCHSTVSHGSAVPVGSATHPTMAACLKCHNDKIAPLECDLCHTGRRSPAGVPTPVPTVAAAGG